MGEEMGSSGISRWLLVAQEMASDCCRLLPAWVCQQSMIPDFFPCRVEVFCTCKSNSRPFRNAHLQQGECSTMGSSSGFGALSADEIEQLSPWQVSKTQLSTRKEIWVQKSSSLVWGEMGLTLLYHLSSYCFQRSFI